MGITVIDTLPTYTSLEDHETHQQSTPASFDIPPVLRRKEEDVYISLTPSVEGFPEATGTRGDLYISEGSLVFFSPSLNKGVLITYPTITLHAISRTPIRPWTEDGEKAEETTTEVPEAGGPCIFCQLDESEGADEDDEPEYETRDLIVTPKVPEDVDAIFEVLSYCASLFPSEMSEDEGEEGIFDNPPDDADLSEAGRVRSNFANPAARNHLESLFDWNDVPSSYRPAWFSNSEATEDAEDEAVETSPRVNGTT